MGRPKEWALSPGLTSILFLAVQGLLALSRGDVLPRSMAGAAADVPMGVSPPERVTSTIHAFEVAGRAPTPVPETEEALLELFDREGTVVFSADDVDVLATQEHRFRAEDVGVITAEPRLRRARLATRR